MAHTTSLTQANDDDEIIELTDIVEKGTVPPRHGQGSVSMESQISDLLSNDSQDAGNDDELDLDALLGESLHQESDFPDDIFAGLDASTDSLDELLGQSTTKTATPPHTSNSATDSASSADSADDVMDFDALLQEMAGAKAQTADTDDFGDSSAASYGHRAKSDTSDSSDDIDDDFLGDLDDVDNLLRDLMPPDQPSPPHAAKSQASMSGLPEVEEDDLASLLAGLGSVPEKASEEVDDLDALLDSIMSPRDTNADDAVDTVSEPEISHTVEEKTPNAMVGFDDLDALLGAAMQPVPAKPVSPPAAPPAPTFPTPEDAMPAQDAEDEFEDLDALLSEAIQIAPPLAPAPTPHDNTVSEFDLDALLNDMRASSALENEAAGGMGNAFANAFSEAPLNVGDAVDAERAAESLDLSDILEDDMEAEELLKGIFAAEEAFQADQDATPDAALYDVMAAGADEKQTISAHGVTEDPEATDVDDFDLDAFLADLDAPAQDAETPTDSAGESLEQIAAHEAAQNLKMQEITLAALSEELGESDDALFNTMTDGDVSAQSDPSSVLGQDTEGVDILTDINFDEFPLDNDLGDPLLISDDAQQLELGEAVLQGLDLLAADIASMQVQIAKLAPSESQQNLMETLQGDFAQLHEDVQQLSERQAMSLAAVEARISDVEAQFAEKFAVNPETMFDIFAEQIAFMNTRLESLEAQPAPLVQDDTVSTLEHLSGIMLALESRVLGLENCQAASTQSENDQADMTNDVAKLLDRVEALELHRHENQDASAGNALVSALEMRLSALEGNVEKAAAEAAARVIREEIAGLLAELSDSAT